MSPTLKACPFCGGAGRIIHDRQPPPLWRGQCKQCGAGLCGSPNETEAITAWNTRALEREAKAEPVAWARRWYVDGVKPFKVKNENGRMVWAAQFHWKPVTETKLFPDDVALYASPPAPEIE